MDISEKHLFKHLVEEIRDYSILVMDAEGLIVFWNEGAERFFQYKQEEVLGKHFRILYTEREIREKVPETMMKEARTKKRSEREGWRVRKDKSEFWANAILAELKNDNGILIGYSKITNDLTSIRQAHQIKLDQKDEVFAIITHEFKNPLASISAYSELISRFLDNNESKKAQDFSKKIHLATQKLTAFVNDLYQAQQSESGSLVLDRSDFDLSELVSNVSERMELMSGTHQISVSGNSVPIMVNADKNKIEQVLTNFISNGIKYSPGATEVKININESSEEVVVKVKDNGIGIPEEQIPRMFQKYQRAKNTGKIEGLGLGLYLCKKIIEAHEGEVWIKSREGEGSTFYFVLPFNTNH